MKNNFFVSYLTRAEGHHATSKLSKEMLQNFNSSFVLDLTATPKNGSNIISFVDTRQLKAENMVKLPVIVYNRKSQEDVFVSAISLRRKLENEAVEEQKNGGRYIRPIVLFQAQPRTNDDSSEVVREIQDNICKYLEELELGDKDSIPSMYVFTSNLKELSGALLHKTAFAFRLSYIIALEKN